MNDINRKNAVMMYADLEVGALGLRSRIADDLRGKCVLRRTLERLEGTREVAEILVFCPPEQVGKVAEIVAGARAEVIGLKESVGINAYVPRRKWALESWRGGIHEATVYDEQVFTAEMVELGRERGVYSVASVPAEAVLIDPELLDEMLVHHHQHNEAMRFTFSQAAPGLLGGVYRLDLLMDLVVNGWHISDSMAYDPANPHMDYIIMDSNFRVETALWSSRFRYLADTQRSFEVLARLWEDGQKPEDWSAREIVEYVEKMGRVTGQFPRELEIDICSETSIRIDLKEKLKVKGKRLKGNGNMPLDTFVKIMEGMGGYDDVCITIGGFGEPLGHPELGGMIQMAKDAGVFGINIETDGLRLTGELAEMLLESEVDVISVYLDANSEEMYQQVKGQSGFEEVTGNIETFIDKRKANGGKGPLIVPHLVKSQDTMAEMEAFYDRWLGRSGAAVIEGYNNYAGQIEDKAVMEMAPPERFACGKPFQCMTIWIDGTVTTCRQDFMGKYVIGNTHDSKLSDIWISEPMEALRKAHSVGEYDKYGLCGKCSEWHR
ncbi:MAG: radical SAM protein [Planctomycetes bacterium]|nr:radical SAM protein [Planctomycetota bacterium]